MKKKYLIIITLISFFTLNYLTNQSELISGVSCLNFKVIDGSNVYFGNNEDKALKQISNTVITFVPNGSIWYDGSTIKYGAVILGYGNGSGLSWFQGGMNERGLSFDSTSVPYTTPNLHNEREQNLVPEIFNCENISEVIDYKENHNVYHQEGSVQSMYVDKSGESVVFNIGLDGEYDYFLSNDNFQLASNFYYGDPLRGNPSSDAIRRYNAAEDEFNDMVSNGNITAITIKNILDAAHFEGPLVNTLYSNIFDLKNGDMYLFFFHQYEEVVRLNLTEELAKGWHSYHICDLFSQELVDKALNEYYEYSILIRFFPADLLILFITIIFDIIASLYVIILIIKRLFYKRNQAYDFETNKDTLMGLKPQTFLSIAITWSLLSFPMIYWNHSGEWWSFFDGIPILQLSLQSFYAFYNFYLLFSILGIFFTAFLVYSLNKKGDFFLLVKDGFILAKNERWRGIIYLSVPIMIGIIYYILELFNTIPKVDFLTFLIMYPLIFINLLIFNPLVNKKVKKDMEISQKRFVVNLIKVSLKILLIWAALFLPLLLTGILDHMYILLLLTLSISLVISSFFELLQHN